MHNDTDLDVKITRDTFEQLAAETLEKLKIPLDAALEDACMSPEEINEVLLVGGSTRIPWVRNWLEEYFEKPPNDNLNADEGVAYGATIMAGVLSGSAPADDDPEEPNEGDRWQAPAQPGQPEPMP